jgi:uncharacterized membrane protein
LASYHLEKVETAASIVNILSATYAVIGLGFFNLVFVAGLFIALAAILVVGWLTGTGLIISPLFGLYPICRTHSS